MTAAEFRALLKASGLTQRALASRLGKDTTTVNRWVRGTLPVPQYAIAYLEPCQSVEMTGERDGVKVLYGVGNPYPFPIKISVARPDGAMIGVFSMAPGCSWQTLPGEVIVGEWITSWEKI